MPEQDVVVAITSGTNDMQAIMNLVWEHLLPAFQDDVLPADEESYNTLASKLAGLTMSNIEGENASNIGIKIPYENMVIKLLHYEYCYKDGASACNLGILCICTGERKIWKKSKAISQKRDL